MSDTSRRPARWMAATDHLRTLDDRWNARINLVGFCQLRPRRDRFGTLVRAIIGQQISTKAAASIDARLRALSDDGRHHADHLIRLGPSTIRSAGLSGVKASYVLNLADAVASGRLTLHRAECWSDEEVIRKLTEVKGIGRWTAEMFLIFALNRPDVLPVGDLGIRVGIRNHFGLSDLPSPLQCRTLTEPWRPFRSVAMWYLWRELNIPAPVAEVSAPPPS